MLSQVIKDELKALVGKGRYLDSDEDLLLYSYDAFMVQGKPEAVLLPVSTEEVSQIMKTDGYMGFFAPNGKILQRLKEISLPQWLPRVLHVPMILNHGKGFPI